MEKQPQHIYSATYLIKGRVQGVYYRASATTVAQRLGLNGYVKNLKDGSVELTVQGTKHQVQQMKDWCKHGPTMASVTAVEESSPLTRIESASFNDFIIRH